MERDGDVREQVWRSLMREGEAAYPFPVGGHHPNFRGASAAARLLADALVPEVLQPGEAALAFPDYVLRGLRRELLERGVEVIVPPRYGKGFVRLSPGAPASAATIAGAARHGTRIEELPPVRLIAVACVAATRSGQYLGKGYGFYPPEPLASLPRAALLHPLMIVDRLSRPDGRLAWYATPTEVENPSAVPSGSRLE